MKTLAAIPCYNERLAIGTLALLARAHVDGVLVIDDGSSDGTAAVATAAGASVIRHEQNGTGQGCDGKGCVTLCRGKRI